MASSSQTFEDILRLVSSPGSAAYEAYASGISVAGYLDCPSPPWDAGGIYRLVAESGTLVIQKLVSGTWVKAETDAPVKAAKTSSSAADDTFSSKTRSILFMDVSGWSKLPASEIYAYASKGLQALSQRLDGYDFINTWGDSIVATFESAKTAAEMALGIQEFFANSYPESGVSSGLTCRVSLHLGEIICCRNALRNELDVFGEAVHVAARLEPVTAPGAIFCTQAFADRLREVQGSAPKAWPFGQLELAKGFGRVEVFAVTGPNAQDPRSLYGQPSSESSRVSAIKDVHLPDESARTRLKGWLNKLPISRSGEAIALSEIEANCGLQAGQANRLISGVVPGGVGAWKLEDLTEHDVILKYVRPQGPSRQPWITRY
jgi:class 3 adenylate cyclase